MKAWLKTPQGIYILIGVLLLAVAYATPSLIWGMIENYYYTHGLSSFRPEFFLLPVLAILTYGGCICIAVGAMKTNRQGPGARWLGGVLLALALSFLATALWGLSWTN